MANAVICKDFEGKTYEVPISDLVWRPSAYGIIIKDDAVLLSKQFGDKYDLPGGGIDLGEMPEAAVIREVKEETGLDVKAPKLIGGASNFFKFTHSHDDGAVQSILLYYVCELVGGELSTDGFDEDEKQYAELAEWILLDDLDTIALASGYDFREHIRKAALNGLQ